MDWTKDRRFRHYWSNYKNAQAWYLKHQVSYWRAKALANDYEKQYLNWLIHKMIQGEEQKSDEICRTSEEQVLHGQDNITHKEEFQMEISDDMIEFLTHSMKHKQERGEIRQLDEQVTYINVDELPVEAKSLSFTDNPSGSSQLEVEEKEKYVSLYGPNASKIQAMETAIQLNFHRNCDRRQPKLWPNMPLNM